MLNIKFYKSVHQIEDLPTDLFPEVVLCGRSNVGKSSFINSLSKRKGIAKTSSSPGKTRSINFYSVESRYYLVDLPGYGYAKVSKDAKEKWQKLISSYINEGKNIHLAFHLIDSRHPATDLDLALNYLLIENEIPYIVILSKIDKLNQSERSNAVKRIKSQFPELSQNDNLFLYSALRNLGKKEIESRLAKLF
jgi:GTP-binding protein